jgi:hypothetical protein
VSSGCTHLFNHDTIDLYDRAPVGAPLVVRRKRANRSAPTPKRMIFTGRPPGNFLARLRARLGNESGGVASTPA